jgi:hydrogenase nickel incorporation protein HypA/HybF
MHEIGLMQDALDLALQETRSRGATRIHKMVLSVGRLAGVEPDALAFAFEAVAADTPAEGADFTIEHVPVVCFCPVCRQEFAPDDFVFRCPGCRGLCSEVRRGNELELASLEVS